MKYRVVGVLLLMLSIAAGLNAQNLCAYSYQEINTYCGNSSGCVDSKTLVVPSGGGYGYGILTTPDPVNCCGFTQTSYSFVGACLIAELRDPTVQTQLANLAKHGELLVASCDHSYVPYRQRANNLDTRALDRDKLSLNR